MKTVILLLSVALVLVDSGALPANAPALQHHRNQDFNLEKIGGKLHTHTHTLPEVLLQILLADVTHLTVTTTNCKEFICEAETILASVKFGDGGRDYPKTGGLQPTEKLHRCGEDGKQVELRRLLYNLKECGQKIYFKP